MKRTAFFFAAVGATALLNAEPAAPRALPPQLTITNNVGKVLTVKRPSPTRTGRLVSNGVVYEFDHYGNIKTVTPPKQEPINADVRAAQLSARIKRLKEAQKRAENELKELRNGK